MNEDLGVPFVFAFDFFAAVDIYDNDVLGPDLFEAEAVWLHENPILARYPHRSMAQDIVPMALVRENVARIGEVLF
jgi:hypothetical protein